MTAPNNQQSSAGTHSGAAAGSTICVEAHDPVARELLTRAVKWIERIENRKEELPESFLDNCDAAPLAKDIRAYLQSNAICAPCWIKAPAKCRQCGARYESPTSGKLSNRCHCGGVLDEVPDMTLKAPSCVVMPTPMI